jgi:hypothetical protein
MEVFQEVLLQVQLILEEVVVEGVLLEMVQLVVKE